jgi:uncharacterized protein (TIGR00251 family)
MTNGVVRIAVQVQSGAHLNNIVGFSSDVLHLKIAAPPVKGRANKELIAYLGKLFGVSKSSVVIEKGVTSKRKVISIAGLGQTLFEKRLLDILNSGT